jgi:hypothetical protein
LTPVLVSTILGGMNTPTAPFPVILSIKEWNSLVRRANEAAVEEARAALRARLEAHKAAKALRAGQVGL